MAIIQCPHGHFYDDEKYSSCPSCTVPAGPGWRMDDQKTVSLVSAGLLEERTVHLSAEQTVSRPVAGSFDDQKTVACYGEEERMLPAGWLVCIKGPMRGKDYRLYPGFNRIGRSLASDICLQDPGVSMDAHCSVVYDQKSRTFFLVPGRGTTVYLGEELVQEASKLPEGGRICLGSSTLELIPFCKGEHVWETL